MRKGYVPGVCGYKTSINDPSFVGDGLQEYNIYKQNNNQMEEKKIEDAQIVGETKNIEQVDTDLHINLSTPNFGSSIISIREADVPKLAKAFYEWCIDQKIDATITNN